MNDERPEEHLDELLQDAARQGSGISDGLRRRVDALSEAFRALEPAPAWIANATPVGAFEAPLVGITTRATGTPILTEAVQVDLPEGFDAHVNVDADGVTVRIELDVATQRGALWATLTIDDAVIAAPFISSPEDPRLRHATLPYGGAGPVRIAIVAAPQIA